MKVVVGCVVTAALVTFFARPADACTSRPTDAAGLNGYTYAPGAKSYATADVRVHYATTGDHIPFLASTRADNVPDTVAFAAETAQTALAKYAEMGFKKMPGDGGCSSNGGDDKLDIYLVKFAAGDGSAVPQDCKGTVCSSAFLIDSTFTRYPTPQEGFKTVVSHELFHGIQNAYTRDNEAFWSEGTAQWAMKQVYPEVSDFEKQLPSFFKEPQRSLDTPPSGASVGFMYGASVWPLFLALNHGPDTIREIIEAQGAGQKVIEATDATLQKKGSSLADAFPTFCAWNVATKTLATEGGYPDAAKYPGIATKPLADGVNGITSGLSSFAYVGKLEGKQGVTLETDATRNAGLLIPMEGGKPKLSAAQKLPANGEGDVLVIVAGTTSKKTDAKFTVHIGEPVTGSADAGTSGGGGSSTGDDGCACAHGGSRTGDGLSAFVLVALGALISRSRPRKR